MIKNLLAFIVCFSIPLVNLTFAGEPDIKLHEKCLYPTVRVADTSGQGYGSGVIVRSEKVDDGYLNVVLTCKHVVENMDFMDIVIMTYKNWSEMAGMRQYPARLYASHPDFDISIVLFLSSKKMPTADLGLDEQLYVGNDLVSFGCALKQMPRLDTGTISGVAKNSIRSDLVSVPGDSGGPVFHNYKLIALKMMFFGAQLNEQVHPVFNIAVQVRLSVLKQWAEQDDKAKLPIDADAQMPKLDVLLINAQLFKPPQFLFHFPHLL